MRFSVIVPVYQVEKYLSCCVDSVLRQTFNDFELILIDDGSTDGSSAICAAYELRDERVSLIRQENSGLSAARNAGIRAAKGDYLIFLDSDDYWLTRYGLETIDQQLKSGDYDAVFWKHKKVEEAENRFDDAADEFSAEPCEIPDDIIHFIRTKQLIVCAWDAAISRTFFEDGALDFEVGVHSEDVEWLARLLSQMKRCAFSGMTLNAYRLRQGSITKSLSSKTFVDLNDHYRRIAEYINESDDDTASMLKTYLGEQASLYILALALADDDLVKKYKDSEYIPYIRYCVTRRAVLIRAMRRLFGVGRTVFLIKKIKRL